MWTAYMQKPPIETFKIMTFPTNNFATVGFNNGVLNGIPEILDSRGSFKELTLNALSVTRVTSNDFSNLCITSTILKCSLGVASP